MVIIKKASMGIIKKGACFALKIEGGSLFAHRADGTTYAAHSLELKVKLKLMTIKYENF